jgi:transcriptional regulator with XRE-family HTH domain
VSETFGSRLRAAREQKGLTQVELAESLGISQSAVAQWESGRSSPAPATAARLQKLLGISPPVAAGEELLLTRRSFGRRPRLPVVGSPAPGDDERILVDASARGEVLAPPQLEGIKGAKAVYVRGRAMEPRYYAGEIVYLNPNRPPNPGDFVFLTVREPSFPAAVGYIRQFAGADLVSVRVYTINPKREELFARQAVIEIATIVGSGLF